MKQCNNIKKEKYYILSCSFGKDSLYLLHYLIENNYPLNEVQFVEPMFDNNITGLLPVHKQFIDYVISRFPNVHFNIIKSKNNYSDLYLKYGCPTFRCCHWCTGMLKLQPLNDYNRNLKKSFDVYTYVGFCYNEIERAKKNKSKNNIYPLVDNKIDEDVCYKWCYDNNLLSPIYSSRVTRDGCWFCPFQSKLQWHLLKVNYPDLFNLMVNLERKRFNLDEQYSLVRSKPLDEYINGYIQTNIFDFL